MPLTPEQCIVGHYVRICDGVAANMAIGQILQARQEVPYIGGPHWYIQTRIVWIPSDYEPPDFGIQVGSRWSIFESEGEYIGETFVPPHEPRYKPTREYLIADRIGYSPEAVLNNPPTPSISLRSAAEIEADSQDNFQDEFFEDVEPDPYD